MTKAAEAVTPPLRASDTAARITDIIDIAMRLSEFLTHETALIRGRKVAELAPLQVEKLRLTALYQGALKPLQDAKTGQKDIPLPLRNQLFASAKRLAEAAAENEHVLRAGCIAADRLIGAIATQLKRQRPSISGYGGRSSQQPPHDPLMAGLAVDRRL